MERLLFYYLKSYYFIFLLCLGHEQYSDYSQQNKKSTNIPITLPQELPFARRLKDSRSTPQLNQIESNDITDSAPDMRIIEQDLGSDADSLPSCEESLTTSESPPNSPELFNPKTEPNRRDSAPASLNIEALKELKHNNGEHDDEVIREMHRRYSSVEERTNRVRFKLQESFQEEEERFSKKFHNSEDAELHRKFSNVEEYKINPQIQAVNYPRKVSSPPCLASEIEESLQLSTTERKSSFDRSRKCSVYSDNSGSYQIMPGQAITRVPSHDDIITPVTKEDNRKNSLQDHEIRLRHHDTDDRKYSLQENRRHSMTFPDKRDDNGNRKFSLQMIKRRPSFSDRKLSLQERKGSSINERKISTSTNEQRKYSSADRKLSACERKISTTADRKLSACERKISTSADRKLSACERKLSSTADRKLSSAERKMSSTDRKLSSSERKMSSSERKLSQEVRKVSLGDTIRAVVGTKKKHERKASQEGLSAADENNNVSNDKKSTWGLIKNKIKKDRKSSNDLMTNGSPRMLRLLSRHDSSSSVESGTPRRMRRSDSKHSQRSEDYDEKSISSYNSMELDDSLNDMQSM